MPLQLDLNTIVSIGALISVIIAVLQVKQREKEQTVKEGQQIEKFMQMLNDLRAAEDAIKNLEKKTQCTDIDMTEMKGDLKYLVDTMREVKEMINNLAPPTIGGKS